MSIFGKASAPPPPAPPPPPPNPPMFGQDMPKRKVGGGLMSSPTILGAVLTPQSGQTGQKTLLGQ